jgi:uncharacterized protein YggU (UPF0235/DUF167 family)
VGTIAVVVKPGARNPGIGVEGEAIVIRVRAPARDGLANEAARLALAGALGVARTHVVLARGASARHKTFEVEGVDRAGALGRLARLARN